jgi:hypothetical protein
MQDDLFDDFSVRRHPGYGSMANTAPGHRFPYEIVLVPFPSGTAVSRGSAVDADQATVAFHSELQLLKRERRQGELVILKHSDEDRPILREPLNSSEFA